MRRLRILSIATLCLLGCGCVEGELLYMLNPDGSGKVQIDVVTSPSPALVFDGDNDDPDEMARKLVVHEISKGRGVTGWSNVKGEFLKDGRFRFRATAYFNRLEDLKIEQFDQVKLVRGPDGAMTLLMDEQKKDDRPGERKKQPPDLAKFTDADWDRYLLKQRIQGQMGKPLINSFLADVKLKITFLLPGEVTEINNLKPVGKDRVSVQLDGNAAIKEFNRRLALPDAEMRKLLLAAKEHELFEGDEMKLLHLGPASATVKKPTGPLFNYKTEVEAAVAGNDELRKRFKIPALIKLPAESDGKKNAPATRPAGKPKLPAIDRETIAAWRSDQAKHGWIGVFREWGFIEFGDDTTRLIDPMEAFQLSKDSLAKLPDGLKSVPKVSVPFLLGFGDIRVTDAMLKEVAEIQNLAGLAVFGPDLTDAGLKELKRVPNLTTLYLQNTNRVTDAGLRELTDLKKLNTLYIHEIPITDAGLTHVKELKSLSTLCLYHTNVTDAGMAELKNMRNLTTLNLRRTKVTGKGIAELTGLKELTALYLGTLPITDDDLKVIAGFTKLTVLDLMGARLSDKSVPALKSLKNLTYLDLQYAGVSKDAMDEIQAALPKCKIKR